LDATVRLWLKLQEEVNYLVDSSQGPLVKGKPPPPGIKQTLEKKEGLFRKHMMVIIILAVAVAVVCACACLSSQVSKVIFFLLG